MDNIDNVDITCTMLDRQTKRRHSEVQKKLRDNSVIYGCIAIQYQLPFNGRTSLEKHKMQTAVVCGIYIWYVIMLSLIIHVVQSRLCS